MATVTMTRPSDGRRPRPRGARRARSRFLEAEVADLRRRLADGPAHSPRPRGAARRHAALARRR